MTVDNVDLFPTDETCEIEKGERNINDENGDADQRIAPDQPGHPNVRCLAAPRIHPLHRAEAWKRRRIDEMDVSPFAFQPMNQVAKQRLHAAYFCIAGARQKD